MGEFQIIHVRDLWPVTFQHVTQSEVEFQFRRKLEIRQIEIDAQTNLHTVVDLFQHDRIFARTAHVDRERTTRKEIRAVVVLPLSAEL